MGFPRVCMGNVSCWWRMWRAERTFYVSPSFMMLLLCTRFELVSIEVVVCRDRIRHKVHIGFTILSMRMSLFLMRAISHQALTIPTLVESNWMHINRCLSI